MNLSAKNETNFHCLFWSISLSRLFWDPCKNIGSNTHKIPRFASLDAVLVLFPPDLGEDVPSICDA